MQFVQADDHENMNYENLDDDMYQEPPTDSEPQYFNPAPLPTDGPAVTDIALDELDAELDAGFGMDMSEFGFDSEDEVGYLEVHD